MAKYLITYDLRVPGANYPEIEDAIRRVGTAATRVLESVWVVEADSTAAGLLDFVAGQNDQGGPGRRDGFMVVTISGPWDRSKKLYKDTDYGLLDDLLGRREF